MTNRSHASPDPRDGVVRSPRISRILFVLAALYGTMVLLLAFFGPLLWLYSGGRLTEGGPFYGAMIDGVWALLFLLAWWLVRPERWHLDSLY